MKKPNYFFIILIVALAIDQLTKYFASKLTESIPVIQNIFHITFVQNKGIIFGILPGFSGIIVWLYLVVLGLLVYFHNEFPKDRFSRIMLALVFGRLGCFFNGCCFGIETTVPWAVKFPNLPGLRHPTQLYSTGAGLILFVILLVIWRRRKAEGQVIYSALIGYGIYRFILEFFRYSDIHLFGLTPSHYVSIVLIIIGCLGLRKIKVV